MAFKCIAIGNRIMGDDSIGIKVLEELMLKLIEEKVEVIFGETDIDYAISQIEDGDFIFVLDSSYFNILPASVTFIPIEKYKIDYETYSQHHPSLINLLKTYKKSVKGYFIGIEVEKIDFNLELSETLKKGLKDICDQVYYFINIILRGINMHDTFLLNKISTSLNQICEENNIRKINQIVIEVNHDSHVNEENLKKHLKEYNKSLVGNELDVDIRRKDIEAQTAIILSISGEKFAV